MHFVKPRKGLFIVILMLLLASLACLGGGGDTDTDSGNTGDADLEATQRSLESTQNALEVQQEVEPTQAPPQGEPESGPTNNGGSGNGPALSNTLFVHSEGIYETYPPEGWEIEDDVTDVTRDCDLIFRFDTGFRPRFFHQIVFPPA